MCVRKAHSFLSRFARQICWFAATKSFPLTGKFLKGIDLRRVAPRSARPADPAVNLLLNGELLILINDQVGGQLAYNDSKFSPAAWIHGKRLGAF